MIWNPARVNSYGVLPGSTAPILGPSMSLAKATLWNSRRIDPTGLYYFNSRYYEPNSGRFISPDPLGHGASMSLYSYCQDPVNCVDPTGRLGKQAGKDLSVFGQGIQMGGNALGAATWNTYNNWTTDPNKAYFDMAYGFYDSVEGLGQYAGNASVDTTQLNQDLGKLGNTLSDPTKFNLALGQAFYSVEFGLATTAGGQMLSSGVKTLINSAITDSAPSWFIKCFPRGTKVETPSGKVSIEKIKEGDLVFASDAEGKIVKRNVVKLVRNATSHWINIHVGGEIIKATGAHPFRVVGRGWMHARDLRAGMLLQSFNGETLAIESVAKVKLVSPEETFNFEVAELHNYFAGTESFTVLTHNIDPYGVAFSRDPSMINATDVFGHGPLKGTTLGQAVEQASATGQLPAGLNIEGNFINDLSHPMGGYWQTANNRSLWVAQEAGLMNVDIADTNAAFKTIQNHLNMSDGGTFFRLCPE